MSAEPVGSLYALSEVAEYPLEWAVLAADQQDPVRLLVVPADANPAAGSGDLYLAPPSACSPLSLRCGFATWLPAGFLAGRPVSGHLDPADAAAALDLALRVREVKHGGGVLGTPLARDTDRDPEYIDWIADTVGPARQALAAARDAWSGRTAERSAAAPAPRPALFPALHRPAPAAPADPRPAGAAPRGRQHGWGGRLGWAQIAAAAALAAAAGLGWQDLSLHRKVERLSQPRFNLPVGEVTFDGPTRDAGAEVPHVALPANADQLVLTVVLGPGVADLQAAPQPANGHLEIRDAAGRTIWTTPDFPLTPGAEMETNILLCGQLLRPGEYRLALVGTGAHASPIQERRLVIDPPAAP